MGIVLAACQNQTKPTGFVARVGDAFLTEADVQAALGGLYGNPDTLDARTQIIEQWVERELLYQEALRRNLASKTSVRQQLLDAERAVLVDALIAEIYEETIAGLTDAYLMSYYETHKERLRTLEPYVRVRILGAAARDSAQAVYRRMRRTPDEAKDSVFDSLAIRHGRDAAYSRSLASNYWPQSRLFADRPQLRGILQELSPPAARVFAVDSLYYYLELVARAPVGTVPEYEWVREQVRTHSAIDLRKQLYERHVQQLRTEALGREDLAVGE